MLEKEGEEGPDSPMSSQSSVREALAGLGLPPPRSSLVEVQRLRDVLRHKDEQLHSLHLHVSSLEATRDRFVLLPPLPAPLPRTVLRPF